MKIHIYNILSIVILLSCSQLNFAQSTFIRETVNLPNEELEELQACYKNLRAFTIDIQALERYVTKQIEEIPIVMTGSDLPEWELDMSPNQLLSSDCQITLQTPLGERTINYTSDNAYKGYLNDYTRKQSWLYISDQILRGRITDENQTWYIQPIHLIVPGLSTPNTFVAYTKNICDTATDGLNTINEIPEERINCTSVNSSNGCNGNMRIETDGEVRYLELAVDVDFEFYQKFRTGSDIP